MHADASDFADGMSKKEVYEQVLEQARSLFDGQRNWVSDVKVSRLGRMNRIANIV